MEHSESVTHAERGAIAAQISREIVRLHAKLYGRGPTKAKTHLSDEYALCVLQEVFTPAERTLIRAGNSAQVKATRSAFQEAVEGEFIDIVEAAAGRTVRAFVSEVHVGVDAAIAVFLFEDPDPPSSPRGDEEAA